MESGFSAYSYPRNLSVYTSDTMCVCMCVCLFVSDNYASEGKSLKISHQDSRRLLCLLFMLKCKSDFP